MSASLDIDEVALRDSFGVRSIAVRHDLLDEPLLELPALQALADRLPEQWVRRESGDKAVDHQGEYVDVGTGSPSDTLQELDRIGLRVSLREIQQDPAYVQLIDTCLDQVDASLGDVEGGMSRRSGYVFVTAPGATTPMHIDPEHSMLLQIRGTKRVFVAGRLEPAVLRREVARYFDGEQCDFDALREGSEEFLLTPGTGVYFPSFVPHWVETEGTDVSVSFSIVFYTQFSRRAELVHKLNKRMRRVGLSPRPPGASERADRVKALVSESWMKVKGSPPLPGPAA